MSEYSLQMDYNAQTEWSNLPMCLEMSAGGIFGGLFIASCLLEFAAGAIIAVLALLVIKGLLLLADLGRPAKAMKVLAKPGSSWVSKGAWGFMLFAIAAVIAVAPLVLTSLPWSPWQGVGQIITVIACLLAAFQMVYDGFLLASSKGIAFWNTGNLPVLFGVSAVSGGVGMLMILAFCFGFAVADTLLIWVNLLVAIVLGLCLYSSIAQAKAGARGAQLSAGLLTKGGLAGLFKGGVVCLAVVVPLLIAAVGAFGLALPALVWPVAGLAEVIAVITLRYAVLKAGMYSPVM